MKRLSNGYEIEVTRRFNEPTQIRVHKLGSSSMSWFTPAELEAFIVELNKAHDEARKEQP